MLITKQRAAVWLLLPVFVLSCIISIDAGACGRKYVSIIIDDLGNSAIHAEEVLDLPAPVTLAILPHTHYGPWLARQAAASGKEVMLHLPLQSVEHHHASPGTLKLHMTEASFKNQLRANIASIPHISGLNNHMGSLLTQHPGYMDWLMQVVAEHGDLYFVDSRTTTKSVARQFARQHAIPNYSRDIFLDPDFRPETIQRQFRRLIQAADENGFAIGIAHPHPRTLEFIKAHLHTLAEHGIDLVPVSTLISRQNRRALKQDVACTGTTCTGL